MVECNKCIKNDVCGKKEQANRFKGDLAVDPVIQTLRGYGFKFSFECPNYATKILGGSYEK